MGTSSRKRASVLLIAASAFVGAVAGLIVFVSRPFSKTGLETWNKQDVISGLQTSTRKLARQLPIELRPGFFLISVDQNASKLGYTVVLDDRVVGPELSDRIAEFKKQMTTSICTDQSANLVLDAKLEYRYSVQTRQGHDIGDFSVDLEVCNRQSI